MKNCEFVYQVVLKYSTCIETYISFSNIPKELFKQEISLKKKIEESRIGVYLLQGDFNELIHLTTESLLPDH